MGLLKGNTSTSSSSKLGRSWSAATKLQSDMIVEVDDVLFHLHKFSLLSKSGLLNKLAVFDAREREEEQHIKLEEFPGGAESFELAAKFCYSSIPVHITASNVAALRCAAEYLEMREDLGEGNLISRTEEFLTYVTSVSWLDSITILGTCADLSPWAEDLHIEQRCVESIARKVATEPNLITWSFTTTSTVAPHQQYYNLNLMQGHEVPNCGMTGVQSAGEGNHVNEIIDGTDNGQAEIEMLRKEMGNLKRAYESIEQKLGSVWRPSVWKSQWRKHKESFRAVPSSDNATPLPLPASPHLKGCRTWNVVKWRRNSL